MKRAMLAALAVAFVAGAAWGQDFTIKDGVITNYKGNETNLDIPSSINGQTVTGIGKGAFSRDSSTLSRLTSVTIPNGVTTIGNYAFIANQLTSVTIPDTVTTIGSDAFASNQLTSVTIPNSVTTIGYRAFYNNQLTSITIPDSVTAIDSDTFASNQLTSVTIPNSVTTIDFNAFSRNPLLKEFLCAADHPVYTSVAGVLFSKDRKTLIRYPEGKGKTYAIPNGVIIIGGHAFSGCALSSVTIPNSVTTIGSEAFVKTGLTSITLPASVTKVAVGGYGGSFEEGRDTTISVTIGANVDIGLSLLSQFYNRNGKKAGTYTYHSDRRLWTYAAR